MLAKCFYEQSPCKLQTWHEKSYLGLNTMTSREFQWMLPTLTSENIKSIILLYLEMIYKNMLQ